MGFRIYDANGNVVGEGHTDENGQISFENLKRGNYSYVEFSPAPGYAIDDQPYTFEAVNNGDTISITVFNDKLPIEREGSITITKKDSNGNALTGAEYLLEYSTDNGESWQDVYTRTGEAIDSGGCTSAVLNNGKLTVNSAGTATFSGLKADRSILYRLTETKAPAEYSLMSEPLYIGSLPVKVDSRFFPDDCETIDGENYCYALSVTAVNGTQFRLPNTGGNGFAFIPAAIILLGALAYTLLNRKEVDLY